MHGSMPGHDAKDGSGPEFFHFRIKSKDNWHGKLPGSCPPYVRQKKVKGKAEEPV